MTGAIAVDGGQFSDGNNPVLISAVNCSGSEARLSDCAQLPGTCTAGGVAGVVCQGEKQYSYWC